MTKPLPYIPGPIGGVKVSCNGAAIDQARAVPTTSWIPGNELTKRYAQAGIQPDASAPTPALNTKPTVSAGSKLTASATLVLLAAAAEAAELWSPLSYGQPKSQRPAFLSIDPPCRSHTCVLAMCMYLPLSRRRRCALVFAIDLEPLDLVEADAHVALTRRDGGPWCQTSWSRQRASPGRGMYVRAVSLPCCRACRTRAPWKTASRREAANRSVGRQRPAC
jgi:hypothetical protein